jgi:hypothetical protein
LNSKSVLRQQQNEKQNKKKTEHQSENDKNINEANPVKRRGLGQEIEEKLVA